LMSCRSESYLLLQIDSPPLLAERRSLSNRR
jgi:hypothetical protein